MCWSIFNQVRVFFFSAAASGPLILVNQSSFKCPIARGRLGEIGKHNRLKICAHSGLPVQVR